MLMWTKRGGFDVEAAPVFGVLTFSSFDGMELQVLAARAEPLALLAAPTLRPSASSGWASFASSVGDLLSQRRLFVGREDGLGFDRTAAG